MLLSELVNFFFFHPQCLKSFTLNIFWHWQSNNLHKFLHKSSNEWMKLFKEESSVISRFSFLSRMGRRNARKTPKRENKLEFQAFNPQTVIRSYKCDNLKSRQNKFQEWEQSSGYVRRKLFCSWFIVQHVRFVVPTKQSKIRKSKSSIQCLSCC